MVRQRTVQTREGAVMDQELRLLQRSAQLEDSAVVWKNYAQSLERLAANQSLLDFIGTIEVKPGVNFILGDPVSLANPDRSSIVSSLEPGIWKAYALSIETHRRDYAFGRRVARLYVVHEKLEKSIGNTEWDYYHTTGCDGGQIGIFRSDLKYFSDFYQFVFDNSKGRIFHSEAGVAAHSGFGDGSFPVYSMNFEPDTRKSFNKGGLMVHFIV